MKKTICAAAVLASFTGMALAADVNLYGVVDTGFTYSHFEGGSDSFEMTSGNYAGPRFGIKGNEQLTDSLRLSFILEAGYASDTGGLGASGKLFNREVQVALEGSWGKVGAGRFGAFTSGSSSMSWYWDLEPFETGYYEAGTQASMINIWTLHSNNIYYVSPEFYGMKFGIQYSMTGDSDSEAEKWADRDQWFNAALRWDVGTVHGLFGIEAMSYGHEAKTSSTDPDLNTFWNVKLAAAWDALPDWRLYAGAAYYRNARKASDMAASIDFDNSDTGKGLEGFAVNLGARYTIGKADLLAQVQYLDGENKAPVEGDETDYSRWTAGIGCHYHFSPRTMGYAIFSYSDGKDLLDGSIVYAHLGITHFF